MAPARSPASSSPESMGAPTSAVLTATSGCPGCGERVDPLRAGHVAILDGRFRYFCRSECKHAYLDAHGRPREEDVATARPPEVSFEPFANDGRAISQPRLAVPPTEPRRADDDDLGRPERASTDPSLRASRATLPSPAAIVDAPVLFPPSGSARSKRRNDFVAVVDIAGLLFGALSPAIGLLGPVAEAWRVPLLLASWLALAVRVAAVGRDPADSHPLIVLAPTGGAVAAACWTSVFGEPHNVAIAVFAALSCAVAIVGEMLVARARARVCAARLRIERALDVPVRGLHADRPLSEVRPGEPIVVEAGDTLGVDAIITAGEARVVPWLGAPVEVFRREGDPVLAGARIVSSRLRMTTTWTGRDRAWVKLLATPATRIDVASPTARWVRLTVERGAPIAALLVGVAAAAGGSAPIEILATMCAGALAFGARPAGSIVALHFARAHLDALARGITYKDARAFERAASATLAVLSARGTVLLGEPEIVAVEPLGTFAVERVLALAAGAEAVSSHPFAAAVLRAARTRGVAADHVRNATVHAGLGVTAVASTGERLVVGGRAIMLEQKIGVAMTDAQVTAFEEQGRSVLLVAVADRLVGLIALQDGLRPGARAAVQKLLDVGIEPILLSGEARDTCETIGRALDIEHVRPEILPAQRGAEVRALAEGGNVVAVIGHAARDDAALGAADVAVAMGAAGSTPAEWAIALASDDVRDAALALAIPHAARRRARTAIALGLAPGLVALLSIGFGVAPLALAPVAALVAAVAAAVHARESSP